MKPVVTNVWSDLAEGHSRVIIESTTPVKVNFTWTAPRCIHLVLEGVNLNFPGGSTKVHDGLIREITIDQEKACQVGVMVFLDDPAGVKLQQIGGMPHRTVVEFGRESIAALLKGRMIGIDPGHGGRDYGAIGPVKLLEKNVVLEIAGYLESLLREEGASPLLTRKKDETLNPVERRKRINHDRVELVLSLHTGSSNQREKRGFRTLYHFSSAGSRELAEAVHEALVVKLPLPDRGIAGDRRETPAGPSRPGVTVELVTITNSLDEAWLRSLTFKLQVARALCNGLLNYFRRSAHVLPGAY